MDLESVRESSDVCSDDFFIIGAKLTSLTDARGQDRDITIQHIMWVFGGGFLNVLYLWVHLAGSQLPGRVRGGPPSLVSQLIVGDRPIIQQVMAEQTSANVFLLRK